MSLPPSFPPDPNIPLDYRPPSIEVPLPPAQAALNELRQVKPAPASTAPGHPTSLPVDPFEGVPAAEAPLPDSNKPDADDVRILSELYSSAVVESATTQMSSPTTRPLSVKPH